MKGQYGITLSTLVHFFGSSQRKNVLSPGNARSWIALMLYGGIQGCFVEPCKNRLLYCISICLVGRARLHKQTIKPYTGASNHVDESLIGCKFKLGTCIRSAVKTSPFVLEFLAVLTSSEFRPRIMHEATERPETLSVEHVQVCTCTRA
jgi:hypothetical protein